METNEGALLNALKSFADKYNADHPLRTADCHRDDCRCLRCVFDDARALITKIQPPPSVTTLTEFDQ